MPQPQPIGLASAAAALLISILWGGNIVSIRIGLSSIPPIWSAFWRMLAGIAFVYLWARFTSVRIHPAKGETIPLIILGLLFTAQIALLNIGTSLTSPGFAVVILNAYSVYANLTGHIAAKYAHSVVHEEPLTGIRILGLTLAVAGVAWLALGHPDPALAAHPLAGNLVIITSSILLGIRQVYTRWLVQTIHPVQSVVWQMGISIPLFLTGALLFEPPSTGPLRWQAVAAIFYQGIVVAGICFIGWAGLLKKHAAGTVSMFAFLVPVSGIFLSSQVFSESIPATLYAGAALILTGVFTVVRLGQTRT
ncbi:MAG: DMT family transporter [Acidobacteria bacterium]|nr:DMT family transporter [Acidobacteriota bacterium]